MSKYTQYSSSRRPTRKEREQVHPVWRGVGFLFMVLAPVMGYFGALLLIDANKTKGWISIPNDFLASGSDPLLYVKIGLTILLASLIFFILQFIGIVIYQIVGPDRYGPMDVPPITGVKKKRAR